MRYFNHFHFSYLGFFDILEKGKVVILQGVKVSNVGGKLTEIGGKVVKITRGKVDKGK